jgi:RNA polymerase sigma-70 factor, ECF subfamily
MAVSGRGVEPRRGLVDGGRAAEALAEVERLEADDRLARYRYLPAIKADLLRRLDRSEEAAESDRRALALAGNAAEREFLAGRLGDDGRP